MTRLLHQSLVAVLLVCALVLLAAPLQAEQLLPRDETARAPGFAAFKARFMRAVREHDVVYVESLVMPDSTFSFGLEDKGLQGFRANYDPQDPESSLWRTLQKIMRVAGSYDADDGMVCYPWLYRRLPAGEGESKALVYGRDVNVRSRPSNRSPVQDTLSWEVVDFMGMDGEWVKVGYHGVRHQTGWVNQDYLHSPMWHRIGFVRKDGAWKIQFLVAGD